MITFKQFILENRTGKVSDDEGKLHEIAFASRLHPKGMVQHFHDTDGQRPGDIHGRIHGSMKPEDYTRHVNNSFAAADALKKHLSNHPDYKDHEIVDTAWTSKDGDREKYTGKPDTSKDQGADVMLRMRHKKTGKISHVGVSLKYANKKSKVSLSNNTPNTLEDRLDMPKGSLSQHAEDHKKRVAAITGTTNGAKSKEIYKKWVTEGHPNAKKIEDSSKRARRESNGAIAYHFNMRPEEDRKNVLKRYLAPEQSSPTMVVHTDPHTGHVRISDHRAETHAKIDAAKSITAHHSGDGMNVHFKDHAGKTIAHINAVNKGRPYKPHEFIPRTQ